MCWTQEIPTCQDGGKITQLVKFENGSVEPLYIIEKTNNWNNMTYKLNPKIKRKN